jgi:hypothetical protein
MTQTAQQPPLPFSRPIAVEEIPPEGINVKIKADRQECSALARANNLPAIASLEADFHIEREAGAQFKVDGTLSAEVRQICVLSLDEFDERIEAPIELRFAPPVEAPPPIRREKDRRAVRRIGDEDEETRHIVALDEAPDPLIGGIIDLGGVAAEFLTLTLDPYPRKPGASFAEPAASEEGASVSPFATLRNALKKGGSGQL